jgi:hypothetical protein
LRRRSGMSSVSDTISIARSDARSPKPSGSLPSGKLCLSR